MAFRKFMPEQFQGHLPDHNRIRLRRGDRKFVFDRFPGFAKEIDNVVFCFGKRKSVEVFLPPPLPIVLKDSPSRHNFFIHSDELRAKNQEDLVQKLHPINIFIRPHRSINQSHRVGNKKLRKRYWGQNI